MANPLTPTRLLAALRAEGCDVREFRSWRTHERDDETGKIFGPVVGVMTHHTVTSSLNATLDLCYDGRTGLPGPLCHGVIDKAGTVWLMSAGRANHAGGGDPRVLAAVNSEDYGDYPPATVMHDGEPGAADGNDAFYGFECLNLGDGKDPWPAAQYAGMVRAHAAICRAYGWSAKSVIGHKEWSDWKPDPRGIDMRTFRRDVAACLKLPAGHWPGPMPDEEDDVPLTNDDIRKIWLSDGIVANGNAHTKESNPFNQPGWTLFALEVITRRTEAKLDALTAANAELVKVVATLAAGLGDLDPAAIVTELAARLEAIEFRIDVPDTPAA